MNIRRGDVDPAEHKVSKRNLDASRLLTQEMQSSGPHHEHPVRCLPSTDQGS